MYCYTNKETGIAALVEAIRIPVTEMRVCVARNRELSLCLDPERADLNEIKGSLDRHVLLALPHKYPRMVSRFPWWQAVEQ
jgi:hypothetical protein